MINFIFTLTITISKYSLIKDEGIVNFELGSSDVTVIAMLGEGS